jgi:hypothetical protein
MQQAGPPAQHATQPSVQLHATVQAARAGGDDDDEEEEEEEEEQEEEEEEHVQQETYKPVKLTLKKHTLREDEYTFKDVRRIPRPTRRKDWKKAATIDGSPAWAYQGRKTKYITYHMPS